MAAGNYLAMREAWAKARPRFEAYGLVLPGSPRFICQPDVCTAYCCHAYSVSLGDAEVARMRRFEALDPLQVLELDEDRRPIELPMVQPYLLARRDNHCAMLSPDLRCGAYNGRPNACRLYPHFVVFWDAAADRAISTPGHRAVDAFEAWQAGHPSELIPMLLGHTECPGFTGDPISETEWQALFERTYHLQYDAPTIWPETEGPEPVTLETEGRYHQ